MNTMIADSPTVLAGPPRRDTYCANATVVPAGKRLRVPTLPSGESLRAAAGDTALLVALLSFVVAFAALRFTLLREPQFVEQVAMPLATGSGVVSVLAILCAVVLRRGGVRSA